MKTLNTILKIVAALAAVAGAVYVVATYGDKIVAWAKKLWASLPQCREAEFVPAPAAEEVPAEEAPAEEEVVFEEIPVTQTPEIAENEPVADETDFAE